MAIDLDPSAIRDHVVLLHKLAAPLAGKGKLIVASYGEDPLADNEKTGKSGVPIAPIVQHFDIGVVDRMMAAIIQLADHLHRNVYCPLVVMRGDLERGKKGGEADIVGVLGLVVDFDDADARRWPERLPLPPDLVIESSAGRFQPFYLFDAPASLEIAKRLGQRLRDFCGSDYGSLDCSHVWRVPGTLNWPNARKAAAGRPLEPQPVRLAVPWGGSHTTLAGLDLALPALVVDVDNDLVAASHNAPCADDSKFGEAKDGGTSAAGDASGGGRSDLDIVLSMLPVDLKNRLAEVGGDRSRRLFAIIKALAKQGLTADFIERIIRAFPNGASAKYVNRNDLHKEITRILKKQTRRQAHHEEVVGALGHKPVLPLGADKVKEDVDRVEELLAKVDHGLYQRGDFVVRPADVVLRIAGRDIRIPGVVRVSTYTAVEILTHFINFQVYDARSEEYKSVNCPHWLAQTFLDRTRHWALPRLNAIITAPTLRNDGSVLQDPGYDKATGILYVPSQSYPRIPEFPSEEDALIALDKLKELTSEFPFVPDPRTAEDEAEIAAGRISEVDLALRSASRSVALSGILTALVRAALPTAPLHAFTSPVQGTGKSKLVDIATMIANGHPAAVISPGQTEEEFEKRFGAELLAGSNVIALDNLNAPLDSALLAQALTQTTVKVRILRTSETPTMPVTALITATGNNLVIIGDLLRRCLRCDLDAGCERPELREFRGQEPVERARRDRVNLVIAGLTFLRAYHVHRNGPLSKSIGAFDEWSERVRDSLIWAGEQDPCTTIEKVRAEDPKLSAHVAVLAQIEAVMGFERWSVRQLIERAVGPSEPDGGPSLPGIERSPPSAPALREALLIVAGRNGAINSKSLGNWLSNRKDRIVNGRQIVKAGIIEGFQCWRLRHAGAF
jgi:hypothetical protein